VTRCVNSTDANGHNHRVEEVWAKQPNLYRTDGPEERVIDNGQQRLVIDKEKQTQQFRDSELDYRNPIESVLQLAQFLGKSSEFNRKTLDFELIKSECTDAVWVYQAYYRANPTIGRVRTKYYRVWVGKETQLILRLFRGHGEQAHPGTEFIFDYNDIPDEVFNMDLVESYERLAPQTRGTFSGVVLDKDNRPVSGASVFIAEQCAGVSGSTDTQGRFDVKFPPGSYQTFSYPIMVRAIHESMPDQVAWTVLDCPMFMTKRAGNFPYSTSTILESTDGGQNARCAGASQITMRMQTVDVPFQSGSLSCQVNIILRKPKTRIEVKVKNVGARDLEGMYVELKHTLGDSREATGAMTDSQGTCVFENLPRGPETFLSVQSPHAARPRLPRQLSNQELETYRHLMQYHLIFDKKINLSDSVFNYRIEVTLGRHGERVSDPIKILPIQD
jgi:hypothetical protein